MVNKDNRLPGFLVIGSMKCGTSSLHFYLNEHPQIEMSKDKDIHFFSKESVFNYGLEWYLNYFKKTDLLKGETSATYVNFRETFSIPERIKNTLGEDIKIILIARDPIDRIISHYIHDFSVGRIHTGLNEFIAKVELPNYLIDYSLYYKQLMNYLAVFDKSNVLVLTTEELKTKRSATLRRTFGFLEVDKDFVSNKFDLIKHDSNKKRRYNAFGKIIQQTPFLWRYVNEIPFVGDKIKKEKLSTESKAKLLDILAPDVENFKKLRKRNFNEWNTYHEIKEEIQMAK